MRRGIEGRNIGICRRTSGNNGAILAYIWALSGNNGFRICFDSLQGLDIMALLTVVIRTVCFRFVYTPYGLEIFVMSDSYTCTFSVYHDIEHPFVNRGPESCAP